MLKFSTKEVLKIEIDEQAIEINYPSVSQVNQFAKDQEKLSDGDKLISTLDILEQLGLKKEISGKLQIKHLTDIVNALFNAPQKKI